MNHLFLIRHGDSATDVVDGKQRELGLSPAGIEQSERLRNRLMQTSLIAPDVVLSSPAQRAIETAAILKPALKKPIQEEEMLVEWRADPDSRLSDEEFGQQWQTCPEAQKPFFRFVPEGETWLEFSTRVQNALNHILQEHAGQTIAIGTPGGVIQASLLYFFGTSGAVMPRASVDVAHTSITHWRRPDSRWILERFNDRQHLPE